MDNCIICKYTKKHLDKNNKIIGYTLEDNGGKTISIYSDALKEHIKNNRIKVTNLTLTSDNRLITIINKKDELNIDKLSIDKQSKSLVTPIEFIVKYFDGEILTLRSINSKIQNMQIHKDKAIKLIKENKITLRGLNPTYTYKDLQYVYEIPEHYSSRLEILKPTIDYKLLKVINAHASQKKFKLLNLTSGKTVVIQAKTLKCQMLVGQVRVDKLDLNDKYLIIEKQDEPNDKIANKEDSNAVGKDRELDIEKSLNKLKMIGAEVQEINIEKGKWKSVKNYKVYTARLKNTVYLIIPDDVIGTDGRVMEHIKLDLGDTLIVMGGKNLKEFTDTFYGLRIEKLDFTNFSFNKITYLETMVVQCEIQKLEINEMKTSANNMNRWIAGCKIRDLSINKLNLSNLSSIHTMIEGSQFENITINELKLPKEINNLFWHIETNNLTINNLDLSNVTNLEKIFYICKIGKPGYILNPNELKNINKITDLVYYTDYPIENIQIVNSEDINDLKLLAAFNYNKELKIGSTENIDYNYHFNIEVINSFNTKDKLEIENILSNIECGNILIENSFNNLLEVNDTIKNIRCESMTIKNSFNKIDNCLNSFKNIKTPKLNYINVSDRVQVELDNLKRVNFFNGEYKEITVNCDKGNTTVYVSHLDKGAQKYHIDSRYIFISIPDSLTEIELQHKKFILDTVAWKTGRRDMIDKLGLYLAGGKNISTFNNLFKTNNIDDIRNLNAINYLDITYFKSEQFESKSKLLADLSLSATIPVFKNGSRVW